MRLPTEIKAIIQDMVWGAQHYDKYRKVVEVLDLIHREHFKGDNIDVVWIKPWDLRTVHQYYLKLNGDRWWRFEYTYHNGKRVIFSPNY